MEVKQLKDFYNTRIHGPDEVIFDDRYSAILKMLPKERKNLMILDVGCGNMFLSSLIKKKMNSHVIGIDISSKSIKTAKGKEIEAIICDACKLPFRSETFDVVIASEILEHLLFPEVAVEESHRVLKKKGIFIVSVPNLSSLQSRVNLLLKGCSDEITYPYNKGHIRFFTLSSLKYLLKERFSVEYSKGVNFFYPFKFVFNEKFNDNRDKISSSTFARRLVSILRFINRILSKIFPNLSTGIIVKFRKKQK